MKVALVLCPQWDTIWATFAPALLTAQLKSRGHEAEFYDINRAICELEAGPPAPAGAGRCFEPTVSIDNPWMDEEHVNSVSFPRHQKYLTSVVERIVSSGAKVAAFSVYVFNRPAALLMARLVKEKDPSIITVFGGPQCLNFNSAREIASDDWADAVFFGEADDSFPAFIDSFEKEGRLIPMPGVLLSCQNGAWTEQKPPSPDMDQLPFADYTGYDLGLYYGKIINTHRGCVRRCTFCTEWIAMKYRRMSSARAFAEICHQLEREPKINKFMFGDSLCNSSMKGLAELCGLVISNRTAIEWSAYAIARPEMGGAILEEMRRSGCKNLFYGVETGSDRLLRIVSKNTTAALNARVLEETRRAGINTNVGWIVGLPEETEDDFQDSLRFLRAQARNISRLNVNMAFLNSELADPGYIREKGIIPHSLYWRLKNGLNTFPVRIKRMMETVNTCREHGIPFAVMGGYSTYEGISGYLVRCMENYENYLPRENAAVSLWESRSGLS